MEDGLLDSEAPQKLSLNGSANLRVVLGWTGRTIEYIWWEEYLGLGEIWLEFMKLFGRMKELHFAYALAVISVWMFGPCILGWFTGAFLSVDSMRTAKAETETNNG